MGDTCALNFGMNPRQTWLGLWVQPVPGEPLRYYVRSASRGGVVHLVDLLENEGYGWCSCEDHTYRGNVECRHIRLAQRYLAVQIVAETLKQQKKHRENPE